MNILENIPRKGGRVMKILKFKNGKFGSWNSIICKYYEHTTYDLEEEYLG